MTLQAATSTLFKVGDVVSLRAAAWLPAKRMCVEHVDTDGYVHCCYFDAGEFRRRCFDATALVWPARGARA